MINKKGYDRSLCDDKYEEDVIQVFVVILIKGYVTSLCGDNYDGMCCELL